ncbi:beta-1,3-galactosyltransferase 5-like isoform X2 [Littorina saxatilis]
MGCVCLFLAPRSRRTVSRIVATGVCFVLLVTWFSVFAGNKSGHSLHRDPTRRNSPRPDSLGMFLGKHKRFTATKTVTPFSTVSSSATTSTEEAQRYHKVLTSNYSSNGMEDGAGQPRVERVITQYQENHQGHLWQRLGRFQFNILPVDPHLALKDVFHRTGSDVTTIPDMDFSFEAEVCKEGIDPFLVILIPSLPTHTRVRDTIRKTWGSAATTGQWVNKPLRRKVALVFLFATESYPPQEMSIIRTESQHYGDIIAGKMTDSYYNLTMKLLLGMQWVATNCQGVSFMAKVDEDTFVNLDLLTQLLDALTDDGRTPFILGYNHLARRPHVMRTSRWNVSMDVYPLPVFPRYLYGHSYVISAELLTPMLHTARKLPYFPPEDAFITGVLAVALNITRIHSQRFAVTLRTMFTCDLLSERFLSVTPMSVKRQLKIWTAFRSGDCDPSDVIKHSEYRFATEL